MALGTGAAVYELDTQVTVSAASAGTLATDTVDSETKTTLSNNAPFCDLVLSLTMSVDAGAGTSILVYRRDLDIDGTGDAETPDANYKGLFVGSFLVNDGTAAQILILNSVPLSGHDCEFYIENQTGQTIATGWTLKATPKSYNVQA